MNTIIRLIEPIKLRIKRVESEDEVSAGTLRDIDSPVTRTRSRRTWNSRLVFV